MNQTERRIKLIRYLLAERPEYQSIDIPDLEQEQKRILRTLLNVRTPAEVSEDYIRIQDEYLSEETKEKGIVDISDLEPMYRHSVNLPSMANDEWENLAFCRGYMYQNL